MGAEAKMPLRILLLGAHGQLGQGLHTALRALGEVRALGRAELDCADAAHFEARLHVLGLSFAPHVIVNAAAYTAVDKAQTEPDVAMQVNAHAVRIMAQQALAWGSVFVHFSTDYVFNGQGDAPWREDDAPAPLSVYGQSKWAGEQAVMQTGGRYLVLRTSWVVGAHGNNFLKTMLRLAAERPQLRVVADQIGVPTSVGLLAHVTGALLQSLRDAPATDPRWGLYHVAPQGETSWHGYAVYALTQAQRRGAVLAVDPSAIEAIATEDYPLPAPRPRNSRLSTAKLHHHFELTLPPWQAGIDAVLDDLLGVLPP